MAIICHFAWQNHHRFPAEVLAQRPRHQAFLLASDLVAAEDNAKANEKAANKRN